MRPVPHSSRELLSPLTLLDEEGCRFSHCCHLGCIVKYILPRLLQQTFQPSEQSLAHSALLLTMSFPTLITWDHVQLGWLDLSGVRQLRFVWNTLRVSLMLSRIFFSWFVGGILLICNFHQKSFKLCFISIVDVSCISLYHNIKTYHPNFSKTKILRIISGSIRIGTQKAGLKRKCLIWLGWDWWPY